MNLSIIIPSRNEMFLKNTIEDILAHREAETEVIAVLDGQWAEPPISQNERVIVVKTGEVVGQRAATSIGAKLAKGKYIMKVDAHCSFDQGFDRKMVEFMEKHGDIISVPIMRNLWVFDWKCYHCGWKKYQGPTPTSCGACGKTDKLKRKMIWEGKRRPQSWSYCFDSEPHFQYFEDWKHRPGIREGIGINGYTETMSLQGSCWMMLRQKYIDYIPTRDNFGSWGNEGIEIACLGWLTGGRVLVNHDTWYAHLFRTQGGDFVPHYLGAREIERTKEAVWKHIVEGKLPNQKLPVSCLIEKFAPVPGWTDEKIKELKNKEVWHSQ